ncbi:hypothetical protein IIA16_06010, partial [bacterium]|nr:hypothetical protein [bacterium]
MADERKKGLPAGAWIAIGCLGLITLACGALYVRGKPLIEGFMEMGKEMNVAHATPLAEAEDLIDLSWTLEMVLDDPDGARGKWVLLEGVAIEPDGHEAEAFDSAFTGQDQGGGFMLGETTASSTRFVLVIMEGDNMPNPGDRVRVLGYIMEANPMAAIMDMVPGGDGLT